MKKTIIKSFGILILIATIAFHYSHNNSNKYFDASLQLKNAEAFCAFEGGWTTTCDYIPNTYCTISGPEGTLYILDCYPN